MTVNLTAARPSRPSRLRLNPPPMGLPRPAHPYNASIEALQAASDQLAHVRKAIDAAIDAIPADQRRYHDLPADDTSESIIGAQDQVEELIGRIRVARSEQLAGIGTAQAAA